MASTQLHTYPGTGGGGVGNREGLTNRIAELFADEVPAFRMAKKTKAIATKHEWQEDKLAAAAKGGIVEGASITYAQPDQRVRKHNYTHIRLRNFDVTFTQEAVSTAGVPSEVAREMRKAMKEIAVDYDAIILDTATSAAGATGTARVSRGLLSAVTTNILSSGSARAKLTEAQVNQILQNIWTQGGNPRVLFCNGFNKRRISQTFSSKTGFTVNVEASTRKAINNINAYEGSFGTLEIVPDRQNLADAVEIVDPEMLRLAVLRDIRAYKGAAVASSHKRWVEGEMCLEWGNQKGHGKITDTTTSGAVT